MKKVLSLFMSVLLVVTSALCFSVGAIDAETKTEALINQIAQTKTIQLAIDDSAAENDFIEISDLNVMFKIQENNSVLADMKVAATAKAGNFNIRAIFGEENLIYIPSFFCYVDLNEFYEVETSDFTVLASGVDRLLDYLTDDYFSDLTLTYAGQRKINGYGEVYVERFGTKAEFYYDGDVLLGFKAVGFDTDKFYITVESSDFLPDYVNGITSGVDDAVFEKAQGFCFNMTPIAKIVYKLISSFK